MKEVLDMYCIDGLEIEDLRDIVDDRTVDALLRIRQYGIDAEAVAKIDEILADSVRGVNVQVFAYPVRSITPPSVAGFDGNRRPWLRVGDMYFCTHRGVIKDEKLQMAPAGEETDIVVWCCLATPA